MTEQNIYNKKIKELLQKELTQAIWEGILFQDTNQKALNPNIISNIEIPSEDIVIVPHDMNMSVVDFIIVITYKGNIKTSYRGNANFRVELLENIMDQADLFTSYFIDLRSAQDAS